MAQWLENRDETSAKGAQRAAAAAEEVERLWRRRQMNRSSAYGVRENSGAQSNEEKSAGAAPGARRRMRCSVLPVLPAGAAAQAAVYGVRRAAPGTFHARQSLYSQAKFFVNGKRNCCVAAVVFARGRG